MSFDSLPSALFHIEYLVSSLSKRGSKHSEVFESVGQLIQSWGREAELHLLRCLLSSIDFSPDARGQSKDSPLTHYLRQVFELNAITKPKPGFLSSFCAAYDRPFSPNSRILTYSLEHISQVLRLNLVQKVFFGICFLKSKHSEARKHAVSLIKKTLPELIQFYSNPNSEGATETGFEDCGVESIHSLLTFLTQVDPELESLGVSRKHYEHFYAALRREFPNPACPAILLPFLSGTEDPISGHRQVERELGNVEMATLRFTGSLSLQIKEIGFAFTSSLEACRQHLKIVGAGETATPSSVATVLSMMIQTHSENPLTKGLPEDKLMELNTWNVAVFVRALVDYAPNLDWVEVVAELDQPGFKVKDRKGLVMLTQGLFEGFKHSQASFPIHHLFQEWNNKEGQCSWIYHILANSDVFFFLDHPYRSVTSLEILKQPIDDAKKEIMTWRSLDLIECLLKLSDAPGLFRSVLEIFKYPFNNCPDLLVMALMQIPPPINAMRQELLRTVISVFFENHPNSSAILAYVWNTNVLNSNHVRSIIMNAMAEWCLKHKDDPAKQNRILDLAQELKAILALANSSPKTGGFDFNVDIACLAARRDFLNLAQWLPQKIQEHGEPFVEACLEVLRKRVRTCVGDKGQINVQLSGEIHALLSCLSTVPNTVSPRLSTDISQFIATCQQSLGRVGGGGGTGVHTAPPPSSALGTTPFGAPPQRSGNPAVDIFSSQQQLSGFSSISGQSDGKGSAFGSGAFGSVGSGMLEVGSAAMRGQFNPTPTSMLGTQASVSPARSMLGSAFAQPRTGGGGSGSSGGWGAQSGVSFRQPTAAPSAPGPASNPTATGLFSGSVSSGTIGVGGLSDMPDIGQKFSDEVQEQANGYFQHIYSQPPQPSMSIEEFIDYLKRFRDSVNRKEKEVFSCMLKNLFEEYRFFPDYPDRELHTTALVYGSIIREEILTGMHKAFAMRAVLVGVKSEYPSKMYWFGVVALNQFKNVLKENPSYCKAIQVLGHFSKLPPHLIDASLLIATV